MSKARVICNGPKLRVMMDDIDEAFELGTDMLPTVPQEYVFGHSMRQG